MANDSLYVSALLWWLSVVVAAAAAAAAVVVEGGGGGGVGCDIVASVRVVVVVVVAVSRRFMPNGRLWVPLPRLDRYYLGLIEGGRDPGSFLSLASCGLV